jgi:polysaccharide export outer membrane protein
VFRTASLSTAGVSPAVADLTRGVLRMFWVKKAAAAGLILAAAVGMGLGIGLDPGTAPHALAQAPQPAKKADPTAKELESRLKQLRDEQAAVEKQLRDAKQRELLLQQLQAIRYQEQVFRIYQLAQEQQALIAPRLEVVVRAPAKGEWAIEIREFNQGREVGSIRCSGLEVAKRVLARTHADPKGPKRLTVKADPECPWAEVKALLDAIKAAGFAEINYSGVLPYTARGVAVTDPVTGVGKVVSGYDVPDRPVELDLRKLDPSPAALPPYVVEPPDILRVEARRRAPKTGKLQALAEPVTDRYLVRPDGTVSLGVYGSVSVTGLTAAKAAEAIRKHLAAAKFEPLAEADLVVTVEVDAYNSKAYYVVVAGPEGETVHRFPCTGSERVVDAISHLNGEPLKLTGGKMWVRRGEQVLPVDWIGITQACENATNYPLLPGDRVYVAK